MYSAVAPTKCPLNPCKLKDSMSLMLRCLAGIGTSRVKARAHSDIGATSSALMACPPTRHLNYPITKTVPVSDLLQCVLIQQPRGARSVRHGRSDASLPRHREVPAKRRARPDG